MGQLTTHVLDIARGIPAAGMAGRLLGGQGRCVVDFMTNLQGRCERPLIEAGDFVAGAYTLVFFTATYFRDAGVHLDDPPFLDEIRIAVGVADPARHYHVPLLVSPWSFSTYRGS
jgi:5-hydroxyisourate hydrolase